MRLWFLVIWIVLAAPLWADDAPRLGIFGVVEQVSPLVVAGREITVPEEVNVISLLGPNQAIEVGDTLAIRVLAEAGGLKAARILQIFPVVGPVTDVQGSTATVMGSAVHVPPDMAVKAKSWLAVSGLWSGMTVITTNLRVVDHGGFGHLTGVVDASTMQIGASEVRGAEVPLDGLGEDVWIFSGVAEDAGLRVSLKMRGVFGGEIDLVLWQGYASLPVASQTYMIHGTGILGTARDAQMPEAGRLIARCVHKGRIVAAAPDGMSAGFAALDCARHIPAD
ncbi:hypothetical protein OS189_09555 [Sulfitobacter sp. F26169L]|uniref:hypothetical protein n=1 Tax=Sulfitobacter sp. F26169L TaxID=2996015 RepID=UPI002260C1ED|nr:hypothetical protein [Sulfitobacter sp. F26169L]MCX7566585.1 hypothetical protein [Sulfitobacter sp. F26169L]